MYGNFRSFRTFDSDSSWTTEPDDDAESLCELIHSCPNDHSITEEYVYRIMTFCPLGTYHIVHDIAKTDNASVLFSSGLRKPYSERCMTNS